MTQEEKDLLLKDLCARLPYNPMVEYKSETYNVLGITQGRLVLCKPFMSKTLDKYPLMEEVKPYLFPLSSINTELICKLNNLLPEYCRLTKNQIIGVSGDDYREIKLEQLDNLFKFFNLFHVDFRNLIEKGLANDATGLNIY